MLTYATYWGGDKELGCALEAADGLVLESGGLAAPNGGQGRVVDCC